MEPIEPLYETTYYQEQIELDKEVESNINILIGLFSNRAGSLNSIQYPLLSQPLELSVGAQFSSWEIAEHYIKEYEKQKSLRSGQSARFKLKCEADTQLTNTDSNNVVKLSDGCVYDVDDIKDSLVHHGKE
ncbi:unnamed protein product [Rhizophagus irregularis]|uniref:Uncharacterized protein n=1 Tax=Rhizophagus irregularis TaxID=588596 RepID=A0A916EJ00_9GLOM|nr:unnamed protein product [Rhizophagus irregularis]